MITSAHYYNLGSTMVRLEDRPGNLQSDISHFIKITQDENTRIGEELQALSLHQYGTQATDSKEGAQWAMKDIKAKKTQQAKK